MLNYIWGGLIVCSLVFALVADIRDMAADTYRNGRALPVEVIFPEAYDSDARRQDVSVRLDGAVYESFYASTDQPALHFDGILIQTDLGRQLRFADGEILPEPLSTIRSSTSQRSGDIAGKVHGEVPKPGAARWNTTVVFEPVRWVKLNAIAHAAVDFAEDRCHHRTRTDRRLSTMAGPSKDRRSLRHSARTCACDTTALAPPIPGSARGPPSLRVNRFEPERQYDWPRQCRYATRN